MTVQEWISDYLVKSGLWEPEANAVVQAIKDDEAWEHLSEVLHKQVEGYTPQFLAVAKKTVDSVANEWLAANKPQHWARPMFNPEALKKLEDWAKTMLNPEMLKKKEGAE